MFKIARIGQQRTKSSGGAMDLQMGVTLFTTFHNPCSIQQEVDITEDMIRIYLLGYSIA